MNDVSITAQQVVNTETVANCKAEVTNGNEGNLMAAFSFNKNPMPKAIACNKPYRSPMLGIELVSDNSNNATPNTANKGAPHVDKRLFVFSIFSSVDDGGNNGCNKGTNTTASEHKNADLPASVPESDKDCVKYPKNTGIPMKDVGMINLFKLSIVCFIPDCCMFRFISGITIGINAMDANVNLANAAIDGDIGSCPD